jgi:alpha-L-fucosidase
MLKRLRPSGQLVLVSLCASFVCLFSGDLCVAQSDPPQTGQSAAQVDAASSGPAAIRAQEAIRDAQTGWFAEAAKTRDERLAWWREARFGCFIHWGAYSVLGGEWEGQPNPGYAEHIMRIDRIPLATYRALVAARFHPDAFDAKQWVALIKGAGMRYIIITSKHHDGFAIWPSDVNPYNIRDVAHFQRDPLRELVDAAHAAGLHVGFYYSHAFDWEDPNAPGNDWDYNNPGGDKKLFGGVDWYNLHPELLPRIDNYVNGKAIPELKELIARYHPDILWFDTPSKLPLYDLIAVVKAVRLADPNMVINGRATPGSFNFGDYKDTADPPAELRPTEGDWEGIPTTNESYGWDKLDPVHKPASYFIQLLAKASAKGGNILMNIGPRGDGIIDTPDVEILKSIGKWMDVNATSIRGTERTPLDRQAWGDSTVRGSTIYLHVFKWPQDGRLVVGGLEGDVHRAYLLADSTRKPLFTSRLNPLDLAVQLPASALDPIDTVVVLEMTEAVHGVAGRLLASKQMNNQLLGFDAKAFGQNFTYGDGKTNRDYVDGLEIAGNSLNWEIRTDHLATYHVTLSYSSPTTTAVPGSNFSLNFAGQTLTGAASATANERAVATIDLGTLRIEPGKLQPLTLTLTGTRQPLHFFEADLAPE